MTFVPQKAVKGQALVDFLAAHAVSKISKLHEDISDEVIEANMTSNNEVWPIFFDDASRVGPKGKIVARVRVVFISPHNHVLPCVFLLKEPCSNNIPEYNVLLVGLRFGRQMGMEYLEAYGDSKLIVNQIK